MTEKSLLIVRIMNIHGFLTKESIKGHIRDSLPAGVYFVTITDPMNPECIDVITVVVDAEGSLDVSPFSINSTDCDSNDGSAEINTTTLGGSGNYAIIWESLGIEIGTGAIINALSVGNYTVTVTDNITGCVGTSMFSVLGGDLLQEILLRLILSRHCFALATKTGQCSSPLLQVWIR